MILGHTFSSLSTDDDGFDQKVKLKIRDLRCSLALFVYLNIYDSSQHMCIVYSRLS